MMRLVLCNVGLSVQEVQVNLCNDVSPFCSMVEGEGCTEIAFVNSKSQLTMIIISTMGTTHHAA